MRGASAPCSWQGAQRVAAARGGPLVRLCAVTVRVWVDGYVSQPFVCDGIHDWSRACSRLPVFLVPYVLPLTRVASPRLAIEHTTRKCSICAHSVHLQRSQSSFRCHVTGRVPRIHRKLPASLHFVVAQLRLRVLRSQQREHKLVSLHRLDSQTTLSAGSIVQLRVFLLHVHFPR